MNLTTDEMRLVASLKDNQGFNLLLGALQSEIDSRADQMAGAPTSDIALQHLAVWKALRSTHAILSITPESFSQELAQSAQNDEKLEPIDQKRLLEAIAWAEKHQDAHLAMLKNEPELE